MVLTDDEGACSELGEASGVEIAGERRGAWIEDDAFLGSCGADLQIGGDGGRIEYIQVLVIERQTDRVEHLLQRKLQVRIAGEAARIALVFVDHRVRARLADFR